MTRVGIAVSGCGQVTQRHTPFHQETAVCLPLLHSRSNGLPTYTALSDPRYRAGHHRTRIFSTGIDLKPTDKMSVNRNAGGIQWRRP